MSVLLALLASALWGTADFLGGTAARRLPALSVVAGSQLVALLALVPVTLALGGFDEPTSYVLPGLVAGLTGAGALGAFYRALALGTMGVVAPIAALGVVVPVVAGLASGESPGTLALAGIAVAGAGVVLASGPELSGGRGGARPLLLAAVAAVGFGAVLVLLAAGSDGEGAGVARVVMTLLVMRLASVAVLSGALLVRRTRPARGPSVSRRDLPTLAVVGLFDVGANAAFAVASQSDLVSVTGVLASLYPVATVLLARSVHGERMVRVQLAGVGATLVGVLLLAAG